jgi:hypothetical protein
MVCRGAVSAPEPGGRRDAAPDMDGPVNRRAYLPLVVVVLVLSRQGARALSGRAGPARIGQALDSGEVGASFGDDVST